MHFLLVKLGSSIHLFSHVVCEKPCAEEETQRVLLVKYIELSKGSKRGQFLSPILITATAAAIT